jgi:hypothetical protein
LIKNIDNNNNNNLIEFVTKIPWRDGGSCFSRFLQVSMKLKTKSKLFYYFHLNVKVVSQIEQQIEE